MQEKIRNVILIIVAAVCIIYPVDVLIIQDGFLSWQYTGENFFYSPSGSQMLEVAIWFLIALVGVRWHNVNWIVGVITVFSYAHSMLLPMLLGCVYCALTVLMGEFLTENLLPDEIQNRTVISYFLGIVALTVIYAILSLLQIGSISNIKKVDAVLFIALCIWHFYTKKKKLHVEIINWYQRCDISRKTYLKLSVVMCFLIIAIGRANVSCDYDSMWYGIRSQYVLNNVNGIYDDLKMIGGVYTYPKGYETYVLPLNGFDSYGFVYAGNIIFAMGVLYITYKMCRLFLDREKAMWGTLIISAIPGIMNMSITAKSDIMTLFIQLITVYFSVLFIKEKKHFYFGMVMASYIYAQTLKPTAVIFSTTILMALVFICIVYKIKPCLKKKSIGLIIFSIIDVALMWYRTYLITGMPTTSVFGKIFSLLGMETKYPYNSEQFSQFKSEGLFDRATIEATIIRIKEFLFAPNSADTDHIIIAWGTTLCTFLMIMIFLGIVLNLKQTYLWIKENAYVCFVGLLAIGEFAGCLLALWVGVKPDGNYFMLYYGTTVIFGVIYIHKVLIADKVFSKMVLMSILITFLPINMLFSGAVNWAWASSFNKIDWSNCGYYNHKQAFKETMYQLGCCEIYDIMSSNPTNKVYALAEHPFIEQVPCVIESELDVSFWGNAELTSTSENFVQFVKYVDYDYIYIAPGYVQKDSGAYKYLNSLFDENMVCSILIENGHILLEIGEINDIALSEEMKEQFIEMY